MRNAQALAALALVLAVQAAALGQVGPDIRYVTATEAEVRSGPSTEAAFYPTNRLRRGDPVEVVQEVDGGWLKIRPPEGSFSYINARFLQHISPSEPNYVIAPEGIEVPVYIGSPAITDHRPTVVGVKLKRGTQVTSMGKSIADAEGAFMPIEPPHGEGRYIRAEVVAKKVPVPGSVVTVSGNTNDHSAFTPAGSLSPSNAPSANPPPTPESLWQSAQQAEQAGQLQDAIHLYCSCAGAARNNPVLAQAALARANFLQSGHQAYGSEPAAAVAGAPAPVAVGTAGRTYPLPAGDGDSTARLIPPPGARTVSATETTSAGPSPAPVSTLALTQHPPPGWVAYKGRLRQAGRAVEGQKTYVLEMEHGGYVRPVAYATASQGVDLASYVGKVVEVWGPAVYRGDIRTNYVTAMRILPQ